LRALIGGNGRASRFAPTLAASFVSEGWQLVAHQKNTTTGFSGSLFKNGKTVEFVMSFRSTEFADDAVRDNQATNALEIKEKGWAFGQQRSRRGRRKVIDYLISPIREMGAESLHER